MASFNLKTGLKLQGLKLESDKNGPSSLAGLITKTWND